MSSLKKFRIISFKKNIEILNLSNLKLKYGTKTILNDFNLKLNQRQILGMLGSNGVGKTTIFNLITGIIKPDSGSIIINSKLANDYPIYERTIKFKIGYVPQSGGYFQELTVYENLKAIGEIKIINKSFRDEKINSLISKFEFDSIRDIKAKFLSGGQKKKLVIALSLISEPKILLLDEPFAALDVMTIKTLQSIIIDLQDQNDISIILCDHQARDLLACVDTAIIINNGEVIAKGTPSNLIKDINAKNFYFGNSFRFN